MVTELFPSLKGRFQSLRRLASSDGPSAVSIPQRKVSKDPSDLLIDVIHSVFPSLKGRFQRAPVCALIEYALLFPSLKGRFQSLFCQPASTLRRGVSIPQRKVSKLEAGRISLFVHDSFPSLKGRFQSRHRALLAGLILEVSIPQRKVSKQRGVG